MRRSKMELSGRSLLDGNGRPQRFVAVRPFTHLGVRVDILWLLSAFSVAKPPLSQAYALCRPGRTRCRVQPSTLPHRIQRARRGHIREYISKKKHRVKYNGGTPLGRDQSTWILVDTYKNIEIAVGDGNDLTFKVEWPANRDSCWAEYEADRDVYLDER